MRRRGYPPEAVRLFCERAGVTKFISTTDMSLLEQAVRDVLNKTALRRMAVLDPVKLVIENMAPDERHECDAVNNPENPDAGTRRVSFGRELWVDRADFMKDPPKKFYRLAPGREVRLKYACIFTCTGFSEDAEGRVTEIRGTWDAQSLGGNASDGHPVRGTIHWVDAKTAVPLPVRLYDRLFTAENPEASATGDFKDFLNPESCKNATALCEPALRDATPGGGAVQFERIGYFCPDCVESSTGAPVFNRTATLRDSWAKIAAKN
jgi:glutaminyl-tRNA synthetase